MDSLNITKSRQSLKSDLDIFLLIKYDCQE
jgi:hypothetical protein